MSQPALKCENNAIFKQNYTLELFIALKMAYCCCLGLRGNLDFPDFPQKKFYNINSWKGLGQRKKYEVSVKISHQMVQQNVLFES